MTDVICAAVACMWKQSLGLVCVCFIIPKCHSPFDVIRVSSVVSLQLLVHIEQDDH